MTFSRHQVALGSGALKERGQAPLDQAAGCCMLPTERGRAVPRQGDTSSPQNHKHTTCAWGLQTRQLTAACLLYIYMNHQKGKKTRRPGCTWVADFSLNCVILRSHPTGVAQDSSQASSAWAGTWDCTKMQARWGSTPQAMYRAADLHSFRVQGSGFGVCTGSRPLSSRVQEPQIGSA